MLKPFLTETPKKIFEQLDCEDPLLQSWDSLQEFGIIPEGSVVKNFLCKKPQVCFTCNITCGTLLYIVILLVLH